MSHVHPLGITMRYEKFMKTQTNNDLPADFNEVMLNEMCQILLVCRGLRRAGLPYPDGGTLWGRYPGLGKFIQEFLNKVHPDIIIKAPWIYDSSKLEQHEIDEINKTKDDVKDDRIIGIILGMGVVVNDQQYTTESPSTILLNATIRDSRYIGGGIDINIVHCRSDCNDDANAETFLKEMEQLAEAANSLFSGSDIGYGSFVSIRPFVVERKWLTRVIVDGQGMCIHLSKKMKSKYDNQHILPDHPWYKALEVGLRIIRVP
jgi:hypothetical protein